MNHEILGTTQPSAAPALGPQIAGLTVTEDDYFLPEGGDAARARFLAILADPALKEIWISSYGFTLQPMFAALKEADARGAMIHLLLDHSQETGKAEAPLVQDLVDSLQHGDVTITTAGVGSARTSDIWHWKAMVVDLGEDTLTCWEGSTNFSAGGWDQGNSARVFKSDVWGETFKSQFAVHKAWAVENEPQYQLKATYN